MARRVGRFTERKEKSMNDGISFERPPLAETFELPTREELLDVEPGDLVKLTFNDRERMWTEFWIVAARDCGAGC